eukprot:1157352-Pelagomonas_calceolata.AAC.2
MRRASWDLHHETCSTGLRRGMHHGTCTMRHAMCRPMRHALCKHAPGGMHHATGAGTRDVHQAGMHCEVCIMPREQTHETCIKQACIVRRAPRHRSRHTRRASSRRAM